jgi:IS30 family transposase
MDNYSIRNYINLVESLELVETKYQRASYIFETCEKFGFEDWDHCIELIENKLLIEGQGLESWDDDQKILLIMLYDKNYSVPTIAQEMKKPGWEIQQALDAFYPERAIRADHKRSYSQEELEIIGKDWADGVSVADLERTYGLTYGTIKSKLQKLDNFSTLDAKRRQIIGRQTLSREEVNQAQELRRQGASWQTIAQTLGRNQTTVYRAAREPNKEFDTADKRIQLMAADYASGMSLNEMMGKYEISNSSILYNLESLNNYEQLVRLRSENLSRRRNHQPTRVYSPQLISPTLKPYPEEPATPTQSAQAAEPSVTTKAEPAAEPVSTPDTEIPQTDVAQEPRIAKQVKKTFGKRDINRMAKDFSAGVSPKEMSEKYGTSMSTIISKLKALPNYKQLKKQRDEKYYRMTPQDIRTAVKMRKQGKKWSEIAGKLKRLPSVISATLRKRNLAESLITQFAKGTDVKTLASKHNVDANKLFEMLVGLPNWNEVKKQHVLNKKINNEIHENLQLCMKKYKF